MTRGVRVLLALSGGGDSMALLHVLSLLRKKLAFVLSAHGVDHGLRLEAATELDQAEALCAQLGIPFSRTVLAVAPGGNLQARARDARRDALLAAAAEMRADLIATAHHADDRAETVLLRLLRGSGPRGLAVLPPRAGVWIRPQYRARKGDVIAHLQRHGVPFADDPSNLQPRFLRTRVRHELVPLLEQLSPQIVSHLCALADARATGEPHAPPSSSLTDEHGVALSLNRAQHGLVGRARLLGQRTARVSLANGRELSLDPVTLLPLITSASRRPRKT